MQLADHVKPLADRRVVHNAAVGSIAGSLSRFATTSYVVRLDLPHGPLLLGDDVVGRIRDAAAEMAGRSSAARDLSLLLDRALAGSGSVALRRGEVQTLLEVASAAGLPELRDRLT